MDDLETWLDRVYAADGDHATLSRLYDEWAADYDRQLWASGNPYIAILAGFTDHIATRKSQIKQAEKTIAENERQQLMVKTTESVQKATMCITDNLSANTSTMTSARESLERIKKRQQDNADKMAAGKVLQSELSGDLSAKMKAAGIGGSQDNSAVSVLERLKN